MLQNEIITMSDMAWGISTSPAWHISSKGKNSKHFIDVDGTFWPWFVAMNAYPATINDANNIISESLSRLFDEDFINAVASEYQLLARNENLDWQNLFGDIINCDLSGDIKLSDITARIFLSAIVAKNYYKEHSYNIIHRSDAGSLSRVFSDASLYCHDALKESFDLVYPFFMNSQIESRSLEKMIEYYDSSSCVCYIHARNLTCDLMDAINKSSSCWNILSDVCVDHQGREIIHPPNSLSWGFVTKHDSECTLFMNEASMASKGESCLF